MNKVVNLFSLFLLGFSSIIIIGSVYDLGYSVYSFNDFTYLKETIIGLSAVILLLGLVRIRRRYEGKRDINAFSGFVFSTQISSRQKNHASLFLGLEVLFLLFFTIILSLVYTDDVQSLGLPLLLVVILLALEGIIYFILFRTKPKQFKIGVSKQLVAYFDREMHLYYYNGLQRLEIYQNMINFKYKKELNLFLSLDILPDDQVVPFLNALKGVLEDKDVFFDDSFHQYLLKAKN